MDLELLDEEHARLVDAELTGTLAAIRPGINAGPVINSMLAGVYARYGRAGIYEIARHAVVMIGYGVAVGDLDALMLGWEENDGAPHSPGQYAANRFAVATMRGEHDAAVAEFQRWQPGEETPATEIGHAALWQLIDQAWARQNNGGLVWRVEPGKRWPPDCDWCCSATARRMFVCRPFKLAGNDGSGMGTLELDVADVVNWYGCSTCTPLVEQDRWPEMLKRYRFMRPNMGEGHYTNIAAFWQMFRENRTRRRPYALPKQRPAIEGVS